MKNQKHILKFKDFWFVFLLFALCSLVSPSWGAEKIQMVFERDVAPDLRANLMVAGDPSQRNEIQQNLSKAAAHARDILDRLDPLDPQSEIFQLINQKSKGTYPVTPDLAKILNTAQQVASKLKEPLAKQISVNVDKGEVTLKSPDIIINIEPLLKGYLADVIMEDLNAAGWEDSFLELGGIYIAKGEDLGGSWKIPVIDKTTENAHHAFYFKASNMAAATVNSEEKGLMRFQSDLKSVTVFTEEGACKALGLAAAGYAAGLNNAKKMLKVAGVTRSVLVDRNGNFVRIPEKE